MNQRDVLLEYILGKQGYQKLTKSMYRRDSHSTLSPIDLYLPMMAVPRALLSWLSQHIQIIPIGESRTIKIPTMPNTDIIIEKKGRDAYSARFVEEGKIIHSFENQTLPGVGGHLMSIGEMYDSYNPNQSKDCLELPRSILQNSGIPNNSAPDSILAVMTPMMETFGKVIDALVSKQIVQKAIDQAKEEVSKAAIPMADKPSGQAGPAQPQAAMDPAQPSKKPQREVTQNRKLIEDRSKLKKPNIIKTNYFKNKLKGTHFQKTENGCLVSEDLLYTPCYHCGVPEFKKTEKGPQYRPCACFQVTLNDTTKKGKFVSIKKNQNTGLYELKFDRSTDRQLLAAFLFTLRDKLDEFQN